MTHAPPPEKSPGYVIFATLAEWRHKRDKPWTHEPKKEKNNGT